MMVPGSSRRVAMAEINVTPLVDVMLVLLIIFMITAPMLQNEMDVNLPVATGTPRTPKPEQAILTVEQDGRISLNGTVYALEDLRTKLTALAQAQPQLEMVLRGDAAAAYGTVVQVMDAVKQAGIVKLGVVTQPAVASP